MIVQMTMTRDELFIIKGMLPLWKKYADGFVFLVDTSTDGTYDFLQENKEKYNILSVLKTEKVSTKLNIESDERQRLYDEALKFSGKIICLDSDEYLDGAMSKEQLEGLLDEHQDTMFYLSWIQYTGKNTIRVDGKWGNHLSDRLGSFSYRHIYRNLQMHSEHIPTPQKCVTILQKHLFVAHIQWLDKKSVAVKQYYWKVFDFINNMKYNANVIDYRAYDGSVADFKWTEVQAPLELKVNSEIYNSQNPFDTYKYRFIRENVDQFNIPNLNDWGMEIH